jgi:galactonate dehydratase
MLTDTDPLNIEAYLQAFGQPEHIAFANHITAMSGIETALWDIKGKALGVPVHVLLGGRIRDRIRLYANINRRTGLQPTPSGFAQAAQEATDNGFTAIKFYPFWGLMDGTSVVHGDMKQHVVDEGLARVRAVRKAVGPEVDVLLQLPPYDMSMDQMIDLAEALAEFSPFWYQTTFPSVEGNARFVQNTSVPVTSPARGAFSLDRGRWRAYLQGKAMDMTNPDLMGAGGLFQMKKIATMAETWGVGFSPHSPYGPVHTIADVHLCANLPNFVILEYSLGEAPWRGTVTTPGEDVKDGYATVPDRPGLGIELDDDIVNKHPLGPHPSVDDLDPVWGVGSIRRWRAIRTPGAP